MAAPARDDPGDPGGPAALPVPPPALPPHGLPPPGFPGPSPDSPAARRPVRLPLWTWSYATFRFADGLTSGLVALAAVLHYGQPLWVLAMVLAAMNLAGVPATFLWGKAMDRGIRRRPVVVAGFAIAAGALAVMSTLPPFPVFVAAAVAFTAFGVATSPAASTMVLQRVPRARWGRTTGALSRRTGLSFLAGMLTSIAIAAPLEWWASLGLSADSGLRAYLGEPHFRGQFAAATLLSTSAAFLAWTLVPPWQPPLPHEAGFDTRLVQATERRFERAVYFPGRLFSAPTWRAVLASLRDPHRLWPLGYAFTFAGSVCLFASYPGVLSSKLGLPAGLVLLAQLPSHLVTPVTYPWASRWGARVGESRGILHGSVLRTLTLPALALAVVAYGGGVPDYPLLLLLHGLMGLSFALIQMNGPLILAEVHPGGRGQGVGTYHAAVGAGTLIGSAVSAVLLALLDYRWSYAVAVAVAVVGFLLIASAHRRHPPR